MARRVARLMATRGFVSFDEMDGDRETLPYQSTGTSPSKATGGPSSTSGIGAHYDDARGGPWTDVFDTLGASWTKAWWHFAWSGTDTVSDQREMAVFYAHSSVGASTGKVRVVAITDNASPPQVNFAVEVYNGTSWVRSSQTGVSAWISDLFFRVEIDLSASPDTARLSINEGTFVTVSVSGVTMIATSTPSFEVVTTGGKGGGNTLPQDIWEVYCYDDIGSGLTTLQAYGDNDATDYHCFGNFPDGSGADVQSEWDRSGCATRGSLNVNDPQSGSAEGDNHNLVTGDGTDQDDEFEVTDQAGSAALDSVYVAALCTDSAGTNYSAPDKLLAAVPSESSTPTVDAGTSFGGTNVGRYKFWPTTPSSATAWTKALQREFRAGYRNDHASATERVYCMVIGTLGKSQAVPGAASSCPAAAARRVFITHNDNAEEYVPHACGCC